MTAIAKQFERFTETDVDDEIVIMRLDNGEFFSLSGTAAAVWRLIDGVNDRASLLSTLFADFAGPEAQIAADIEQFLDGLRENGLIAEG